MTSVPGGGVRVKWANGRLEFSLGILQVSVNVSCYYSYHLKKSIIIFLHVYIEHFLMLLSFWIKVNRPFDDLTQRLCFCYLCNCKWPATLFAVVSSGVGGSRFHLVEISCNTRPPQYLSVWARRHLFTEYYRCDKKVECIECSTWRTMGVYRWSLDGWMWTIKISNWIINTSGGQWGIILLLN